MAPWMVLGGPFTAPQIMTDGPGGPCAVAMDGPGGPIIGGTIRCVTLPLLDNVMAHIIH